MPGSPRASEAGPSSSTWCTATSFTACSPDGPGALRRFLHRRFDDLHWRHYRQPWNAEHVNGTIRDTGPFAAVLVAASFLAPWATLPLLVAGVLQSYVMEEWIHQSVHFYAFHGRYFRELKRQHLYHHTPAAATRPSA